MLDRAMKEAIQLKRAKNPVDASVEQDEDQNRQSGNTDVAPDQLGTKSAHHIDVKKRLVPATEPNDGHLMAGKDGDDHQADHMGVDEHKQLNDQPSAGPLTKSLHSQTSNLKGQVRGHLGDAMHTDESDPGAGEDVQDAHVTAQGVQHREKMNSPANKGNYKSDSEGNYDAGGKLQAQGKPMAAARERMKAMFSKKG